MARASKLADAKFPKFEFSADYDYGFYGRDSSPGNRHFVPRLAKLKALGGESITFYSSWRKFQFEMNGVMAKLLRQSYCDVSVLPPCSNYEAWTDPAKAAQQNLEVDPCPDCDVRFSSHSALPILAPCSILTKARWKKRRFSKCVILIGTPSHITCAFLREGASSWICEYFDPAGQRSGSRVYRNIKTWVEQKLAKRFKKRIKFKSAAPRLDFQSDPHDVMCQTWIWFWVYFRVIRKKSHQKIVAQVKDMIEQHKSLHIIHLFGSWLSDLHKLDCKDYATESQLEIIDSTTP